MPIAIGLIILCVVFCVFGSKTEDAVVLYYDPPGAEPVRSTKQADAEDAASYESAVEDVPADAPAEMSEAATAQDIYDSITL